MREYIPYILSGIAILVTLYIAFHKESHDDRQNNAHNDTDIKVSMAQQATKLDMILSSVGKIEIRQEQQATKVDELATRVITVEQSCKSLHKRVDAIDGVHNSE